MSMLNRRLLNALTYNQNSFLIAFNSPLMTVGRTWIEYIFDHNIFYHSTLHFHLFFFFNIKDSNKKKKWKCDHWWSVLTCECVTVLLQVTSWAWFSSLSLVSTWSNSTCTSSPRCCSSLVTKSQGTQSHHRYICSVFIWLSLQVKLHHFFLSLRFYYCRPRKTKFLLSWCLTLDSLKYLLRLHPVWVLFWTLVFHVTKIWWNDWSGRRGRSWPSSDEPERSPIEFIKGSKVQIQPKSSSLNLRPQLSLNWLDVKLFRRNRDCCCCCCRQGLRPQWTGVWPRGPGLPGASVHEQVHYCSHRYGHLSFNVTLMILSPLLCSVFFCCCFTLCNTVLH